MMGTLPRSEEPVSRKPIVAAIGDSEDMLGAIELKNNQIEFVSLDVLVEEPNLLSVRNISGVILCGLNCYARFVRAGLPDNLGIVVVVNDLDEYSAALRAGAPVVLIKPVRSDLLYSQIENQLRLVREHKRSDQWLRGSSDILEMIASGAEPDRTIEALARLLEEIAPETRCAILEIDSDTVIFSSICAPSLSRLCKAHLLQSPVGRPMLDLDWRTKISRSDTSPNSVSLDGEWGETAWAKALSADGFRVCLFLPVLNSNRQPRAVLALFGTGATDNLEIDSQSLLTATRLIVVVFDKRKHDEDLTAERERLSLALTAGKLGVWNWDLITNKLVWSDECKLFFGYSDRAEVTFEDFLAALHPMDRDRTMNAIEESIRKDALYDIEYRVVHPDGTMRWISATGHTFRDEFDRPTRMGGVARDVTEKKQFDEELQENQSRLRSALNEAELARREAETAIKAKDQFLAILSHELRTPLTPIMLAASWLRNAQDFSEQARNAFDMIYRNAELEARLIDDLLDLTRIERNQLKLQFRIIDLHNVLRAAIEVCEAGVQEKRQRLNLQLAAARSYVACDVARLQQVFWNLLKNAIKFTPEGGSIFVTSWNEKNRVFVGVSDSGIGIDPGIMSKIFVAFEQGDKETVKQYGGLGLGLAISKAIIDAHGGAITVRSDGKDRGSAFTVRLYLAGEPVGPGNTAQE